MRQSRWSSRASADLEDAHDYIARDDPGAALRVVRRILAAARALPRAPEIGRPGRVGGTRELVIPQTPYIVAYRVTASAVEILAVVHHARKWPGRL